MKNDKKNLIIWATVALVIGVIIGMIITNATTGDSKASLKNKSMTPYERYSISEINQYIEENKIDRSKAIVIRESTNGELRSGKITHYSLDKYDYTFSPDTIILKDKITGEINEILIFDCHHITVEGHDFHYHAVFPEEGGVQFGYFMVN